MSDDKKQRRVGRMKQALANASQDSVMAQKSPVYAAAVAVLAPMLTDMMDEVEAVAADAIASTKAAIKRAEKAPAPIIVISDPDKKISDWGKQIQDLEAELTTRSQRIHFLERERDQFRQERDRVQKDNEVLRAENSEHQRRIEAIKREAAEHAEALKGEIEEILTEKEDLEVDIRRLKNDLGDKDDEYRILAEALRIKGERFKRVLSRIANVDISPDGANMRSAETTLRWVIHEAQTCFADGPYRPVEDPDAPVRVQFLFPDDAHIVSRRPKD